MANYCHLSYEERKNIEDGLNSRKSINEIAKELGRCHSTILREIERNKVYSKAKNWSLHPNYNPINQHKYDNCIKLENTPYVCNGCPYRSGCRKGINLTEEEVYNINIIRLIFTSLFKKRPLTSLIC